MWQKFWNGNCRWCGKKAKLSAQGRCDLCEEHYKKNRVRGGRPVERAELPFVQLYGELPGTTFGDLSRLYIRRRRKSQGE